MGTNILRQRRIFDLKSIYSKYGLETLLAPSCEICLVALKVNSIYAENVLEALLATSEEISLFANDIQFNYSQYGLQN
jgi:hypothetical protein